MYKKIIITVLAGCLMQACTKNESPENTIATAKTEAVKTYSPDPQIIKKGEDDIATYGEETLQYLLDQEYPDRYTVLSVDNIKFMHQESNGLFTYTWNVRFIDNQSEDVLGCDDHELSWNKQTTDIEPTLNQACFTILEHGHIPNETVSTIPTTSPVKITVETNPYHSYISMIKIQSVVDDVSITNVTVNRGNCPLLQQISTPRRLGFGQTTAVDTSNCGREKIIEVIVSTDQGDWKFGL